MTKALIAAIFCVLALPVFSQKIRHTISGTVREAGSLEKLPGVVVADSKSRAGTATNNYGFYSLTLPADTVKLQYTFVGYDAILISFVLTKDTVIDVELGVKTLKE